MKTCACGLEFGGRERLNAHRRDCDAFWQSVYAEMARISTMLYGRPMAISMDEWINYRDHDFPRPKALVTWAGSWTDIQLRSGLGLSSTGRGSLAMKVKIATVDPLDIISGSVEFYPIDIWADGLAICTDTYERTGRMMLR